MKPRYVHIDMGVKWFPVKAKPMTNYPESELEASLKRAFVNGKADYILLDSRRNPFLWAGVELGRKRGWLKEQFVEIDEQSSQLRYRLTDEGKRYFGV